MKIKLPALSLVIVSIFLFQSCSSYLTSSENVSKTKNTYDNVLVIGRSKDKTARIKFENNVVAQLLENGINASASHSVGKLIDLNKKYADSELPGLKQKLMSNGYDGVLVTNLIDTAQYTDVIPGGTSTAYVPTRVGRFGRYISYYPVTTWEPSQLKQGTVYIFESSLYRLAEQKGDNLQWVGRFEIKDPTNLKSVVSNYAKDLTKALVKNSIAN